MPAVNIAVEIENVRFQHGSAVLFDRRTHTQARDAAQRRVGCAVHFDGEDTRERRPIVLHPHVRGRIAELAPEAIAANDAAADAVRPAEQPGGPRELAGRERLAHRRARHALTVDNDARHRFHAIAEPGRVLLEHVQIARAPRAEAEIVADQQIPDACAANQDALDEVLRSDLREAVIEAHHVRGVDAVRRQELELLAQRREACRRLIGCEEFPRVRLERHRAREQSARARGILQPGEHHLVAEVHAVEIADRQREGARAATGTLRRIRMGMRRERR